MHSLGIQVKRGEQLGTITDAMGETEIAVIAEDPGLLLDWTNLSVVNQGEAYSRVAKVKNAPKV